MSADYQGDSFLDLLSENYLWTSINMFSESPWKGVCNLYPLLMLILCLSLRSGIVVVTVKVGNLLKNHLITLAKSNDRFGFKNIKREEL